MQLSSLELVSLLFEDNLLSPAALPTLRLKRRPFATLVGPLCTQMPMGPRKPGRAGMASLATGALTIKANCCLLSWNTPSTTSTSFHSTFLWTSGFVKCKTVDTFGLLASRGLSVWGLRGQNMFVEEDPNQTGCISHPRLPAFSISVGVQSNHFSVRSAIEEAKCESKSNPSFVLLLEFCQKSIAFKVPGPSQGSFGAVMMSRCSWWVQPRLGTLKLCVY